MGEELFDVNLNSLDMQEEAIDVAEFTQPTVEDTPAEDKVELEDSTEETATEEVVNKETKETKETKEEKKEDLIDVPEGEINDTTDSEDKIETPNNEADSSPILPFASLLQEKGFLPHLDMDEFSNEEDPVDALTSAIRNEISIANEGFINSFPKELLDMARAVANGVPLSQLKDNKLQELEYTTISEDKLTEDTNLQKKLVRNYLKEKGFKDAKIEREVTRYEDLGDLETEAKDALEELKSISKQKQEYAKQEYAERQKQLEAQNKQLLGNIHLIL